MMPCGVMLNWSRLTRFAAIFLSASFFMLMTAHQLHSGRNPQGPAREQILFAHFPITVPQGKLQLMRFEYDSSHRPINLFSEDR
jgi:hypothetical protein